MIEISIHAPRVGCDGFKVGKRVVPLRISIHAPRVGCDPGRLAFMSSVVRFQSTHPVWGATRPVDLRYVGGLDFNPRTPCGVRPFPR